MLGQKYSVFYNDKEYDVFHMHHVLKFKNEIVPRLSAWQILTCWAFSDALKHVLYKVKIPPDF